MINAIKLYRISNFCYRNKIPLLPKIIKLLIFFMYNSSVPHQAKIGKGTILGYGGIGVVIHKRTVIGENCTIGTGVTIGGKSGHFEVPEIGDNVYISTGAKVLGPIKIGNNAIIGANAVVIKNVPKNAIVAGVPSKIIKYRSSVNEET